MTGLLFFFFNCFPVSRIYGGKAKLEKRFQERVARSADPGSFLALREVLQLGSCQACSLPHASALSLKVMVSWSEMWSRVTTVNVWMRERRPGSDLLAKGTQNRKLSALVSSQQSVCPMRDTALFFNKD